MTLFLCCSVAFLCLYNSAHNAFSHSECIRKERLSHLVQNIDLLLVEALLLQVALLLLLSTSPPPPSPVSSSFFAHHFFLQVQHDPFVDNDGVVGDRDVPKEQVGLLVSRVHLEAKMETEATTAEAEKIMAQEGGQPATNDGGDEGQPSAGAGRARLTPSTPSTPADGIGRVAREERKEEGERETHRSKRERRARQRRVLASLPFSYLAPGAARMSEVVEGPQGGGEREEGGEGGGRRWSRRRRK